MGCGSETPHRALRMGSRRENGALVFFEHLEPEAEIVGVIGTIGEINPKIGTKERSAQLRDKLFARIAIITEALLIEGTIKAGFV